MIQFIKDFKGTEEELKAKCTEKGVKIDTLKFSDDRDQTLSTYYPGVFKYTYRDYSNEDDLKKLHGNVYVFNGTLGSELPGQVVKYNMRKMNVDEAVSNQNIQLYEVLDVVKPTFKYKVIESKTNGDVNYIAIMYDKDCYLVSQERLNDEEIESVLKGEYE